jgi:ribonuclease HI
MLLNCRPLLLTGSVFQHNAAAGTGSYGGALMVRASSGGVEVLGCSFTNNSAELQVCAAGIQKCTQHMLWFCCVVLQMARWFMV